MCVGLPSIGGVPEVTEAANTSPKPVLPKIGTPAPDATAVVLPRIGSKKQ